MKNAIIIASVASMIDQFNISNIELLKENGFTIDVACNFKEGNTCTTEKINALKRKLDTLGVEYHQIDFERGFGSIKGNIHTYKQIKALARRKNYDIMHCHSPIGGLIARLAFKTDRKTKNTKVVYTAHGFHFYKGASFINWFLIYPIERFLSRMTDVLITINREDFTLATKRMKAKNVVWIPGIGIDIKKIKGISINRNEIRERVGIATDAYLIFSVGELNQNKNHEIVIKAISNLKDRNIHYAVAGKGEKHKYLEALAHKLNVSNQIHLLGFREDVIEICKASDLYIHPSFREGLPVALMEAIASSCPVLCSRIRGNIDVTISDCHFDPSSVRELEEKIICIKENSICNVVEKNYIKLNPCDVENVLRMTSKVYGLERN